MGYRIGIDSGGTHIIAQAYNSSGELLAENIAGPGNSLINSDQTKINLENVLTKLFKELPTEECELILAGVAGSQSAGNQKEIEMFIEDAFHRPTIVISDAELARLKGLQGSDGILVISGTGSIVLGQFNQRIYRAGGWGHLLGDQGSAYDLVREAFRAMLTEADQGKIGEMTELILSTIGAKDVYEAVQLFNRLPRNELAAFAEELVKQGEQNESFQEIMKNCGQQLASQVLAVLDQVKTTTTQIKIAITGSVLTNNLIMQKSFEQTIINSYPEVTLTPLVGTNASGVLYFRRF